MKYCSGFTLVEMLVVVAIISLLAAIVYPSYAGYVIQARRIEGQNALLDIMQKQERYYSLNNTYLPFSSQPRDPDERLFRWWSGASAAHSAYELSGRACPGLPLLRCIELRAEPGTAKVDASFRDEECKTLTLDNMGKQGATGPRLRCWP